MGFRYMWIWFFKILIDRTCFLYRSDNWQVWRRLILPGVNPLSWNGERIWGNWYSFANRIFSCPAWLWSATGVSSRKNGLKNMVSIFFLSWLFFSRRNPFTLHSSKCIVWPWNEFQMVTKLFKPSVVLEMKRKLRIAQSKNRQCIISTHESMTIQWLPHDTR